MMLTLIFASLVVDASSSVIHRSSPQFLFSTPDASTPGKYGKDKCKCVGIDNQKGSFSMVDYMTPVSKSTPKENISYPIEVGASCGAWEDFKGSKLRICSGDDQPEWCFQKWCYVDPCSCDLEIPPKPTGSGITFQGAPAYWSYDTCGGKNSYSAGQKKACVNQKEEKDCAELSKCAWDGSKCLGKELVGACKAVGKLDEAVHGQDDCRCIGHASKHGIAKMSINDTHVVDYSANVGGKCGAWEQEAHPACKVEGKKPGWCSKKWCWVDPCKCKTSVPPKATMQANSHLKFQGIIAHWSYATCGSEDQWSADSENKYCHTQKDSTSCLDLKHCAWTTDKKCLEKEVAEFCAADAKDAKSGAYRFGSVAALFLAVLSFA